MVESKGRTEEGNLSKEARIIGGDSTTIWGEGNKLPILSPVNVWCRLGTFGTESTGYRRTGWNR